ncbi:MAG: class I SAM-dependent methyltransferase [Verrucomicrobiae bacterium]|nr:class I SAM-dependent methyltransferase [Verrucomicrobiae bacterium]
MDPNLLKETEALRRMWDRHDAADLRDYLVASVEDPRLNLSSILMRHFLLELLFGPRFAPLQEAEVRFSMAMNWMLQRFEHPMIDEDVESLRRGLQRPMAVVEGVTLPPFLHAVYTRLPEKIGSVEVPNYLDALLTPDLLAMTPVRLPERILNTFALLWRQELAGQTAPRLTVLEPACGSANDYRFFAPFGLAPFVDYAGFDLCAKNVDNARALCPEAHFAVGNVLEIPQENQSVEVLLAQDLFEHLSPAALEQALAEITRVTRRAMCLGFFQMHEEPEHLVRPVEEYYWNRLSLPRVRERLEGAGFAVQAIHLDSLLVRQFHGEPTHNPHAYVLRAWRR